MVDTSNLNKTGLYQLILHRGSAFKKHLFEKKHAKLTVLCEDVLVYGRSIFSPHETRLRRDSVRPSVPYRKMYGYDSSPAGQMRSTRTTFVGLPLRLIRSRYLLRGRNAFTRGVGSTVGTLSQKARSRPPPTGELGIRYGHLMSAVTLCEEYGRGASPRSETCWRGARLDRRYPVRKSTHSFGYKSDLSKPLFA